MINPQDTDFAALKVWVDSNSDGVTQAGELKGLDALSITALNLNASRTIAFDNGNLVGLLGSYDSTDGSTHALADVWLATQAPAEIAVPLRTAVSDMTESLGRFTEQFDGLQSIAGPALNLPATAGAANPMPLAADLSRSLAAQLSAFVDQNSISAASTQMALPPAELLNKDLMLAAAAPVNGSVDPLTGKPSGK